MREEERLRRQPLLTLLRSALGCLTRFRPHVGAGDLLEVLAASLGPPTPEACKGDDGLVEALVASLCRRVSLQ